MQESKWKFYTELPLFFESQSPRSKEAGTDKYIKGRYMYKYDEIKPKIFKEENQEEFLAVRDRVHKLLENVGAVKLENVFSTLHVSDTDMWLAYMDRLVELGEIQEIKRDCMAQHKVFVSTESDER